MHLSIPERLEETMELTIDNGNRDTLTCTLSALLKLPKKINKPTEVLERVHKGILIWFWHFRHWILLCGYLLYVESGLQQTWLSVVGLVSVAQKSVADMLRTERYLNVLRLRQKEDGFYTLNKTDQFNLWIPCERKECQENESIPFLVWFEMTKSNRDSIFNKS